MQCVAAVIVEQPLGSIGLDLWLVLAAAAHYTTSSRHLCWFPHPHQPIYCPPPHTNTQGWRLFDWAAWQQPWDVPWGPSTTAATMAAWVASFATSGVRVGGGALVVVRRPYAVCAWLATLFARCSGMH